jgi:FkbM family methyltransferase
MNPESGRAPSRALRLLGRLSRRVPYFRGKWRIVDLLFRYFRHRYRATEIITLDGCHLSIQCNLWDEVQHDIWWLGDGGYEVGGGATRYLKTMLKSGMVFLDVGANVGYYSLVAARRVGEGGLVHSFEPVTAQFTQLCANIERNRLRNIVANRKIVANHTGALQIHVGPRSNSGQASVLDLALGAGTETVESVTLDDYVASQARPHVDVIKVDVEGYEWFVLTGASVVLREHKPLLMIEVRSQLLQYSGVTRDKLFSSLAAFGYEPFEILKNGRLSALHAPQDGQLIVFRQRC